VSKAVTRNASGGDCHCAFALRSLITGIGAVI